MLRVRLIILILYNYSAILRRAVSNKSRWLLKLQSSSLSPLEDGYPKNFKPSKTRAIVHFIGGFGLANTPETAYEALFASFRSLGYYPITTKPRISQILDHRELAATQFIAFERHILGRFPANFLEHCPVIFVGHSLGAKLLALSLSYRGLLGKSSVKCSGQCSY